MKIGASTFYGIINKSVIESVNELEKAGFDIVELMYEYDNYFSDEEIDYLKKKNLDFSMHCPFVGMMPTHLNLDFADQHLRLFEKSMQVAVEIGCAQYVLHGCFFPMVYGKVEGKKSREFFIDLFIERFFAIFEKFQKAGLKILMENLGSENEIGGKVEDIVRIQKSIPAVGFCFDIAHAVVSNEIDEIFGKLKIDYVHITDNLLIKDDHMVVGEGKIDFKDIISRLKNTGFDGKIILENLSFEECVKSRDYLGKII
jgi:sugar phosphate isomerase/epimerase